MSSSDQNTVSPRLTRLSRRRRARADAGSELPAPHDIGDRRTSKRSRLSAPRGRGRPRGASPLVNHGTNVTDEDGSGNLGGVGDSSLEFDENEASSAGFDVDEFLTMVVSEEKGAITSLDSLCSSTLVTPRSDNNELLNQMREKTTEGGVAIQNREVPHELESDRVFRVAGKKVKSPTPDSLSPPRSQSDNTPNIGRAALELIKSNFSDEDNVPIRKATDPEVADRVGEEMDDGTSLLFAVVACDNFRGQTRQNCKAVAALTVTVAHKRDEDNKTNHGAYISYITTEDEVQWMGQEGENFCFRGLGLAGLLLELALEVLTQKFGVKQVFAATRWSPTDDNATAKKLFLPCGFTRDNSWFWPRAIFETPVLRGSIDHFSSKEWIPFSVNVADKGLAAYRADWNTKRPPERKKIEDLSIFIYDDDEGGYDEDGVHRSHPNEICLNAKLTADIDSVYTLATLRKEHLDPVFESLPEEAEAFFNTRLCHTDSMNSSRIGACIKNCRRDLGFKPGNQVPLDQFTNIKLLRIAVSAKLTLFCHLVILNTTYRNRTSMLSGSELGTLIDLLNLTLLKFRKGDVKVGDSEEVERLRDVFDGLNTFGRHSYSSGGNSNVSAGIDSKAAPAFLSEFQKVATEVHEKVQHQPTNAGLAVGEGSAVEMATAEIVRSVSKSEFKKKFLEGLAHRSVISFSAAGMKAKIDEFDLGEILKPVQLDNGNHCGKWDEIEAQESLNGEEIPKRVRSKVKEKLKEWFPKPPHENQDFNLYFDFAYVVKMKDRSHSLVSHDRSGQCLKELMGQLRAEQQAAEPQQDEAPEPSNEMEAVGHLSDDEEDGGNTNPNGGSLDEYLCMTNDVDGEGPGELASNENSRATGADPSEGNAKHRAPLEVVACKEQRRLCNQVATYLTMLNKKAWNSHSGKVRANITLNDERVDHIMFPNVRDKKIGGAQLYTERLKELLKSHHKLRWDVLKGLPALLRNHLRGLASKTEKKKLVDVLLFLREKVIGEVVQSQNHALNFRCEIFYQTSISDIHSSEEWSLPGDEDFPVLSQAMRCCPNGDITNSFKGMIGEAAKVLTRDFLKEGDKLQKVDSASGWLKNYFLFSAEILVIALAGNAHYLGPPAVRQIIEQCKGKIEIPENLRVDLGPRDSGTAATFGLSSELLHPMTQNQALKILEEIADNRPFSKLTLPDNLLQLCKHVSEKNLLGTTQVAQSEVAQNLTHSLTMSYVDFGQTLHEKSRASWDNGTLNVTYKDCHDALRVRSDPSQRNTSSICTTQSDYLPYEVPDVAVKEVTIEGDGEGEKACVWSYCSSEGGYCSNPVSYPKYFRISCGEDNLPAYFDSSRQRVVYESPKKARVQPHLFTQYKITLESGTETTIYYNFLTGETTDRAPSQEMGGYLPDCGKKDGHWLKCVMAGQEVRLELYRFKKKRGATTKLDEVPRKLVGQWFEVFINFNNVTQSNLFNLKYVMLSTDSLNVKPTFHDGVPYDKHCFPHAIEELPVPKGVGFGPDARLYRNRYTKDKACGSSPSAGYSPLVGVSRTSSSSQAYELPSEGTESAGESEGAAGRNRIVIVERNPGIIRSFPADLLKHYLKDAAKIVFMLVDSELAMYIRSNTIIRSIYGKERLPSDGDDGHFGMPWEKAKAEAWNAMIRNRAQQQGQIRLAPNFFEFSDEDKHVVTYSPEIVLYYLLGVVVPGSEARLGLRGNETSLHKQWISSPARRLFDQVFSNLGYGSVGSSAYFKRNPNVPKGLSFDDAIKAFAGAMMEGGRNVLPKLTLSKRFAKHCTKSGTFSLVIVRERAHFMSGGHSDEPNPPARASNKAGESPGKKSPLKDNFDRHMFGIRVPEELGKCFGSDVLPILQLLVVRALGRERAFKGGESIGQPFFKEIIDALRVRICPQCADYVKMQSLEKIKSAKKSLERRWQKMKEAEKTRCAQFIEDIPLGAGGDLPLPNINSDSSMSDIDVWQEFQKKLAENCSTDIMKTVIVPLKDFSVTILDMKDKKQQKALFCREARALLQDIGCLND